MLEFKHIVKKFGNKVILDSISFSVRPGEIALLLGKSGSGKTTLLRILNNLEAVTNGTITFNQELLNSKKAHNNSIAPVTGMVFQQFNLFDHLTVEQNITLALEKVLKKNKQEALCIAHNLLKHYNLLDKASSYPPSLSGGQKQRVALARTLALRPSIICLDEPTSALDPSLTSTVIYEIEELANQNFTILIASHDVTLIKKLNCTIYMFFNGSIQESTTSKEFLHNPDKYPHIKSYILGTP